MKVINDIILNQSNQSSLDLGTTNDVILIQSDNEVSLNSTDNATYQSVLSCSQTGTPAVEMQASDFGSTFSRVQVLNTGTLFIESGDGTNLNQIQMTPTITTITTPTTLYSAQQNGDLEVRADGTLNLWADYQGNQTNISMLSDSMAASVTDGTTQLVFNLDSSTPGAEEASILSQDISTGDYSAIRCNKNGLIELYTEEGATNDYAKIAMTYSRVSVKLTNNSSYETGINATKTAVALFAYDAPIDDPIANTQSSISCSKVNGQITLQSVDVNDLSQIIIRPNRIILEAGADTSANIILRSQGQTSLAAFDDDADANANGLTEGMIYQTTGLGASPLNVAGIVMIKQ